MMKTIFGKMIFVGVAVFSIGTRAACDLDDKKLWNYEGNIDGKKIALSFSGSEGELEGMYTYAKPLADIHFSGTFSSDEAVKLNQLNDEGKVVAVFDGVVAGPNYKELFKEDRMGSCDIAGHRRALDSDKKTPFYFSLSSITSATLSSRYGYGKDHESYMNDMIESFHSAVVHDDRSSVASSIKYPLVTYINDKRTTINNRKEFIERYDEIMTEDKITRIKNDIPRYLFTKYDQVLLGSTVWFTPKGYVSSL